MIRRAQRRRAASISSMNFLCAIRANNFFDKIDIPLQIAPIARDLPYSTFARALALLQSEACENLIDNLQFDRNPDDSMTFLIAERNVARIRGNLAGGFNFFCRCTACDFMNQFG